MASSQYVPSSANDLLKIVNQCQFVYNSFGQLTTEYQSHSGAVNTMSTPNVQYGYANGSANTVRPTSLTYPDGRVLTYDYGTTDGIDDASSRIFALVDDDMGDTHLAEYSYLGRNSFVKVDYTEPDLEYVLFDLAGSNDPDTGDIYSGFDRFGRVKDSRWYDYGSSADADRIKYGYDRNGNRIWRQNTVADALGKHFDELYGYDLINRLKDLDRGTLNGGKDGVTDLSFAECWALDQTGNWKNYRQDDDGSGTWDLNQHRAANTVNEITDISESAGPSWVTPVYNRAGNMTTMPQPSNPTSYYTATYDAWNRLVKLVDGSDTVSEYAYDGARRRVIQKAYVSGVLDETRHMYSTADWRNIEERVGTETTADKQFVWGLRYIDDIVLRDDTTQRLYGMQDGNWNVTSIADDAGDVQERFAYSAYGTLIFMNASFTVQAWSGAAWETLYCGYRYDISAILLHVRNRIYHPTMGGWLQRDPIGMGAELSLYQYVLGNPILLIDPSGLWSWGSWQHHWLPQGEQIASQIEGLCPGIDIHSFTTRVDPGFEINSMHWWIHYGQFLAYNVLVQHLLNSSGSCCIFLLRMMGVIYATWIDVHNFLGRPVPPLSVEQYEGTTPTPGNPTNFADLLFEYCFRRNPCFERVLVNQPAAVPAPALANPVRDGGTAAAPSSPSPNPTVPGVPFSPAPGTRAPVPPKPAPVRPAPTSTAPAGPIIWFPLPVCIFFPFFCDESPMA